MYIQDSNLLNRLWYDLCEDVWNKNVVIDVDNIAVTILAVRRWYDDRNLSIPRVKAMEVTRLLIELLDTGKLHHQDYGEAPEGLRLKPLCVPKVVLAEDIRVLQSMTPDILQETGDKAGFHLGVYGYNEHHPLAKWD